MRQFKISRLDNCESTYSQRRWRFLTSYLFSHVVAAKVHRKNWGWKNFGYSVRFETINMPLGQLNNTATGVWHPDTGCTVHRVLTEQLLFDVARKHMFVQLVHHPFDLNELLYWIIIHAIKYWLLVSILLCSLHDYSPKYLTFTIFRKQNKKSTKSLIEKQIEHYPHT